MKDTICAIAVFDIDGVVRDVSGSYRRALADTVEYFTGGAYRPTSIDIDRLKSEGIWNNDWHASQELVYRHFETKGESRDRLNLDYNALVAFFQSRYRGTDENTWNGYICQEPLLLKPDYFANLTQAGILWGFFSGAPRAEVTYLLEGRLGVKASPLTAMEDAPEKPDPSGLLAVVEELERQNGIINKIPVIYVGDTVADLYVIQKARQIDPSRTWIGVGVLPPHVQQTQERRDSYTARLLDAGAVVVLSNVEELTPSAIASFAISS